MSVPDKFQLQFVVWKEIPLFPFFAAKKKNFRDFIGGFSYTKSKLDVL